MATCPDDASLTEKDPTDSEEEPSVLVPEVADLTPQTILVTGARGMVGQAVVRGLGHWPFVLLTPSRQDLDLTDFTAVLAYLDDHQPDLIIHAAGRVGGIQANMAHPTAFLMDNLMMGKNVVMAAAQVGVPRLINLGSSCMYPKDCPTTLTEAMLLTGPFEPTNEGYALAKVTVARLCQYLSAEQPALAYKTLIPCNLYGPGDHYEPDRSHLIAAVIAKLHQAVTRHQNEVTIWGSGTVRRECLLVDDLADCIRRAVETPQHFEALPMVMNVGMGVDFTVNEIYAMAAEVLGYSGTFVHDPSQPEGMRQKCLNIQAQQQWGWHPHHTFSQGLALTYEAYCQALAHAS